MKRIKEKKGITLVALIITIVVLLILAVVAIGAVQESKIIGHAENAAGSFNQAKANEIDALAKYEQEINKYIPKAGNIEYYIFSIETETGEAGYIVKVNYENNTCNNYGFNIEGSNVNYGGGNLEIGEKVEGETNINIDDGNGTTIPENMEGGNIILSNNNAVGYKKGKNIYTPGGAGYYKYTLVEDLAKIAEIESLIVTIN